MRIYAARKLVKRKMLMCSLMDVNVPRMQSERSILTFSTVCECYLCVCVTVRCECTHTWPLSAVAPTWKQWRMVGKAKEKRYEGLEWLNYDFHALHAISDTSPFGIDIYSSVWLCWAKIENFARLKFEFFSHKGLRYMPCSMCGGRQLSYVIVCASKR